MEYEILDIQTVALHIDGDESKGEEITFIEVFFTWESGYENNSRLQINGKPTDEEILQAISKRGNELKLETISHIPRSIKMKGTL